MGPDLCSPRGSDPLFHGARSMLGGFSSLERSVGYALASGHQTGRDNLLCVTTEVTLESTVSRS